MHKQRLAGSLTALILLCTGLSVSAEAYPPDWQPPDWVPTNFIDALRFENQYGNVRYADGMICTVRREDTNGDYIYSTELSGSIMEYDCASAWEETYTFEMPQPPTSDDTESWNAFYALCYEIGLPYSMVEMGWDVAPYFYYRVTLYETIPDTTMDITWNRCREGHAQPISTQTYSFETDADNNITETDLFAWLPDSIMEFEAFTSANETVSIHEGYLIYADDVAYDGGYGVSVKQEGATRLEEIMKYSVSKTEIVPPPGGQGHEVRVYKVLTPGNIKITFTQEQQWSGGDSMESDEKYYEVHEDGTITETEPFDPRRQLGDCNGDGFLSSADAVMLMRYLTGQGTLIAPGNADLNGDNIITAADLSRMKQYLLETNTDQDMPLPNTLSTPWYWKAIDAAKNTEFTAIFRDLQPSDNTAKRSVVLCNADTGETITEMEYTDINTWHCTAALIVTEACTMSFYAELSDESGTSLRTNTISISFSEVPPPA